MSQKKSCLQLVEKILKEIYGLPSGPFWAADVLQKRYPFPITLDVGKGRQIYINPEINGMLASLSKSVMEEYFRSYKPDFTNLEWGQIDVVQ